MKIVHLSAECYPVAKVGGLGDVVGALPKYLVTQQIDASVVMPKYDNDWIRSHSFTTVFSGSILLGEASYVFHIQREIKNSLGFPLYVIDIPELYNRPGIYMNQQNGHAFKDEFERVVSFQIAALEWIRSLKEHPHVIHCHDHHSGLLPFMLTQCFRYRKIRHIPTAITVHNGEYHGIFDKKKSQLLPEFDEENIGLLDWDGNINCLAAAVKCCWAVTTVSPSYMKELSYNSNGLERLFQNERQKSYGIINGIDTKVWDPEQDSMISHNYTLHTLKEGKYINKTSLCDRFNLNPEHPTVSYIGRLAHEKGADLLPDVLKSYLESSLRVNFIVLGTGDPALHRRFKAMRNCYSDYFSAVLDYNEPLAHKIYAGSDFMIMPSRVEPCGLNQMYAMRYGSIPIVRNIGGLRDTVKDIKTPRGYGITFNDFTLEAANEAVERALRLYGRENQMADIRKQIMNLDFSWNASAREYIKLYKELSNQ